MFLNKVMEEQKHTCDQDISLDESNVALGEMVDDKALYLDTSHVILQGHIGLCQAKLVEGIQKHNKETITWDWH
jgi:hypothetical protein